MNIPLFLFRTSKSHLNAVFFKSSILCKYKICQPWKLHQLESLTDPLWNAVPKSHQQYFFEKEFISLGFWENGGGASHLQSVRERKRFLEQFLRTAVSWDKRILYEFNIILLIIFCPLNTLSNFMDPFLLEAIFKYLRSLKLDQPLEIWRPGIWGFNIIVIGFDWGKLSAFKGF